MICIERYSFGSHFNYYKTTFISSLSVANVY